MLRFELEVDTQAMSSVVAAGEDVGVVRTVKVL